ncbi:MAG: hypothetical protein IPJ06_11875 [Saprospiraceae bacterium]|nr:hypothetical protein [Saprospiraceae bacterium]
MTNSNPFYLGVPHSNNGSDKREKMPRGRMDYAGDAHRYSRYRAILKFHHME